MQLALDIILIACLVLLIVQSFLNPSKSLVIDLDGTPAGTDLKIETGYVRFNINGETYKILLEKDEPETQTETTKTI